MATALAGGATSYLWLMLSRIALGAVTATAGPGIASLIGDYFPAAERARMYGFVLAVNWWAPASGTCCPPM
ncbi:putative hypothetical integral membrane protein [Streptomyces viridochromogenes Tue57]|uniref:Putative hypothetical integral membrane protein n=1 Tax=Streptomyces viridochromogenes Tue57 TaxID=1160705 RepID=L8P400_STRVR|nr:putative hypothetical integral membrane protein [Streptomyces viridochromogenes Tue57]